MNFFVNFSEMTTKMFTSTALIRGHVLKRTYGRNGSTESFECDGEVACSIRPTGGKMLGDFYSFRADMNLQICLSTIDKTHPPLVRKGREVFPTVRLVLQNITLEEYTEYMKLFEHEYDESDEDEGDSAEEDN